MFLSKFMDMSRRSSCKTRYESAGHVAESQPKFICSQSPKILQSIAGFQDMRRNFKTAWSDGVIQVRYIFHKMVTFLCFKATSALLFGGIVCPKCYI